MKEQDLHIGCSYLATAGAIEKIITPTGRATLSAAFDYFSTGHLKGIPLTGEVKKQLGFIYYGSNICTFKYRGNVLAIGNDGSIGLYNSMCEGDAFRGVKTVEYVHQLQILYFSLTGEFLPYKQ